jgi:cation transport regulator ChaC
MAHGVLWELTFGDLAALDRYEGVAEGGYEKLVLPVIRAKGGAVRALVYLGRPDARIGHPPADYMENIAAAAAAHGLPREQIAYLRLCGGLPPEAPPKFRAIKNGSIQ